MSLYRLVAHWVRWLRRTEPILAWELERGSEPSMRWLCADCHLPNAEHRDQWMACRGKWLWPIA